MKKFLKIFFTLSTIMLGSNTGFASSDLNFNNSTSSISSVFSKHNNQNMQNAHMVTSIVNLIKPSLIEKLTKKILNNSGKNLEHLKLNSQTSPLILQNTKTGLEEASTNFMQQTIKQQQQINYSINNAIDSASNNLTQYIQNNNLTYNTPQTHSQINNNTINTLVDNIKQINFKNLPTNLEYFYNNTNPINKKLSQNISNNINIMANQLTPHSL